MFWDELVFKRVILVVNGGEHTCIPKREGAFVRTSFIACHVEKSKNRQALHALGFQKEKCVVACLLRWPSQRAHCVRRRE